MLNHEPDYQISSLGRIRKIKTHKIMAQHAYTNDYLHFRAFKNGTRRHYDVHPLVAHYFISPRPPYMLVDHIDRNKQNNAVSNLRYVTRSFNALHSKLWKNKIENSNNNRWNKY